MTVDSKQFLRHLQAMLTISESQAEKDSMLFWLLEHVGKVTRAEILAGKSVTIDEDRIFYSVARLNANEPLQYVLGEAEFYGRKFTVNPNVLIPRPETELLVRKAFEMLSNRNGSQRILDIGTGSGCVAISLALELKRVEVFTTDISEKALDVARGNTKKLSASVEFLQHDILVSEIPFHSLDAVVSNPPYVKKNEKVTMSARVLDYEPPTALFVPDADPLVFHRAIATKAKSVLNENGILLTEINEALGRETSELFQSMGYRNVQIMKDLAGKDRIVIAVK